MPTIHRLTGTTGITGTPTSQHTPTSAQADKEVARAEKALQTAELRQHDTERKAALGQLARDVDFRAVIKSLGTVENAANALSVAMTYLRQYNSPTISADDVHRKMVGHVGATTSITRTWLGLEAALGHDAVRKAIDDNGIRQAHVVVGPGHGAAAVFALYFLDGTLERIYPNRYPRTAQGLQNLLHDFCRPSSPLPSHTFPGVPSVSEGGELGYSFGIAAGAGLASPDAILLAQIGDKEAESGPLLASIENHNTIYDFRKGLVLPVLHANGLGISSTSIVSARSDAELRGYLKGLGYAPFIVDAENIPMMKRADEKAVTLEQLILERRTKESDPGLDERIETMQGEVAALRQRAAEQANALLQRYIRQGVVNLASKKHKALTLEATGQELTRAKSAAQADPNDQVAAKRVQALAAQYDKQLVELRRARTPFIVYREAKGGGMAPAFVDGKRTKGAPVSHQLILSAQALTATDPAARKILEGWLNDLTGGRGPAALVPAAGSALGEARTRVLPDETLRIGAAPLATGHTDAPPVAIEATPFLASLFEGRRGVDKRGANDLIDAYLAQYLGDNRGRAFLFSADTAESNRLKLTMASLGRHFNAPTGEFHPRGTGPAGDAIDALSEQYLMAMAQGVVNSGKQAIISNYEAFFPIVSSMVRQFIKFRKQAAASNTTAAAHGRTTPYRPAVPNLVLHLSSLGFAQDHNGFSHQNPGFIDDLVAEPRDHVRVLMPAEANSALLLMDEAVKGKDQVVAVVSDKQPRQQFLSPDEAKALVQAGAAKLPFASSVTTEKPDVVLAAAGGYHVDEVLAASQILKTFNARLSAEGAAPVRFSVVGVVEPLKLRAPEEVGDLAAARLRQLGGKVVGEPDTSVFDAESFAHLFPAGVPVVFGFGGYKRTADSLFAGRDREVSCHGYVNEGSTTTRFDMMVRNSCDRFTLVVDAVERAFQNGSIAPTTRERIQRWCAAQLEAHAERMARGEETDPPEINTGVWPQNEQLAQAILQA